MLNNSRNMKKISRMFQWLCGFGLLAWCLGFAVQDIEAATTQSATKSKTTAAKTTTAKKAASTKSAASTKTAAKKAPAVPKNVISQDPYIGAIVVDAQTGKVLFEDRADTKAYPASVLKLMDLLIILEKIEQKQVSLQDKVIASTKASKTGGSQVWLKEKEECTIEDLLYALMIQSANDAAVALAEKVAGSTEAFVEIMNQKAKLLGMKNTLFQSVHGLPPGVGQQPDVTTPRDFSILARELLKHPATLEYTATKERPFRAKDNPAMVLMRTHNHLLSQVEGCDGLKTGYFTAAGFSIAATATRNNQRVIAIVMGSRTSKGRDAKTRELISKAFSQLNTRS